MTTHSPSPTEAQNSAHNTGTSVCPPRTLGVITPVIDICKYSRGRQAMGVETFAPFPPRTFSRSVAYDNKTEAQNLSAQRVRNCYASPLAPSGKCTARPIVEHTQASSGKDLHEAQHTNHRLWVGCQRPIFALITPTGDTDWIPVALHLIKRIALMPTTVIGVENGYLMSDVKWQFISHDTM